jgi:hypothetical protein
MINSGSASLSAMTRFVTFSASAIPADAGGGLCVSAEPAEPRGARARWRFQLARCLTAHGARQHARASTHHAQDCAYRDCPSPHPCTFSCAASRGTLVRICQARTRRKDPRPRHARLANPSRAHTQRDAGCLCAARHRPHHRVRALEPPVRDRAAGDTSIPRARMRGQRAGGRACATCHSRPRPWGRTPPAALGESGRGAGLFPAHCSRPGPSHITRAPPPRHHDLVCGWRSHAATSARAGADPRRGRRRAAAARGHIG